MLVKLTESLQRALGKQYGRTSKWSVKTSICSENAQWPTVVSSTATRIYVANTLAYTNCNPAYS